MLRRFPTLLALLALVVFALPARAARVEFTLRDIDGKLVELGKLLEDGPVLVGFWATWCDPCKEEIPHLFEIEKEFEAENLQLVLIAVDGRSQPQVKPFVTRKGWTCPVLLDRDGQTMKSLKGSDPPYTLVVGTGGELLSSHSGYKDGDEKRLRKELAELLRGGGEPVAPVAIEEPASVEDADAPVAAPDAEGEAVPEAPAGAAE